MTFSSCLIFTHASKQMSLCGSMFQGCGRHWEVLTYTLPHIHKSTLIYTEGSYLHSACLPSRDMSNLFVFINISISTLFFSLLIPTMLSPPRCEFLQLVINQGIFLSKDTSSSRDTQMPSLFFEVFVVFCLFVLCF